ncbi:unnamed protein product [Vitrella brassicaformis CCMP3155]|uniref:dolichyl-phosphate beta-glucosyltransferase n=1 Tax=Vitrella brassicaformis (strain CCMP3155) TaxID=1169540 RepID=A0A0G4GBX3_VITBC|nr:unnamed protein product [Vitrella brassicaformis CCMP3155]|eukprot:CEM26614.1 unnamed protein product [Vitrella brassicaformis CCMP3155]
MLIGLFTAFAVVVLGGFLLFVRWFLEPYLQWRRDRDHTFRDEIADVFLDSSPLTSDSASHPPSPGGSSDVVSRFIVSACHKVQHAKGKSAKEVELSLVIPAYNEADRLPPMLKDTAKYLLDRRVADPSKSFEVLVVCDGSRDQTARVARTTAAECGIAQELKVVRLRRNMGKGFAVKMGMLLGQGESLLMVDADGATDIRDLSHLEAKLHRGARRPPGKPSTTADAQTAEYDVVFGSRAHLQKDAVAHRAWYRNVLMYGFHVFVTLLVGSNVKDTQCGFKLFTRAAARDIFASLNVTRWAFDIEVLVIAQRLGLRVAEVAVNWQEIPGSKLNVALASLQMARDIILVRLLHALDIWKPCPGASLEKLLAQPDDRKERRKGD